MDFKHIFRRKKQSSVLEGGKKPEKSSTAGANELLLEYEGFLIPSNSRPLKPSTPAKGFSKQRSLRQNSNPEGTLPEDASRASTTVCNKSAQGVSDRRDTADQNNSQPKRLPTRRKKGHVSLNRSSRTEQESSKEQKANLSPVDAPEQANIGRRPHPRWFLRCLSTTSRARQPSPPPSFTSIPPYYGNPIFDDCDLTALPALPGYEKAAPGPPERLPSGAAARAAAAAQKEVLDAMQNLRLVEPKIPRDSESGIGIEVRDREEAIDLEIPVIRKDPLSVLPEELVGQILSYLDADSVLSAELVSTNWHQSASSRHVWRAVFQTECQNVYQTDTAPNTNHLGIGTALGCRDWKSMWRARKALEQRWKDGHAAAIYLEGHKDSVYCVQFDEDKILTGSRDRTIRIWDTKTYMCTKILGIPSRGPGSAVHPLPEDTADRGHRPFTTIFSPPSEAAPTMNLSLLYHTGSVLCLQYDDRTMITGSSDCTLIIWDVKADYKPIMRLRCHAAGVLDVCFDERHIVSCSKDATVCLWDRNTGNLLRKMTGHRGPVNAVQLRGDLVVSASGDGIAKLWNIRSGLCIKEFPSKDRGMACVEFSPDSRTILAGGNDQVVYQFDASTGELVREMKGHEGLVRSLHLDSRSGRVVSGSYDTSVKAYDLRTGETVVNFTKWTSSWILSAKADYRRIIATSQDSRAVIMDFGYQLPGIESLEI